MQPNTDNAPCTSDDCVKQLQAAGYYAVCIFLKKKQKLSFSYLLCWFMINELFQVRVEGLILKQQVDGTVPLNMYYSNENKASAT